MITADQLVLHAIGDYVIQSDWMARNKTSRWVPAVFHAITYSMPFLLLTRHVAALLVIFGTHAVIDHYRLARYVVWAKNWIAPRWFEDALHTNEDGSRNRLRNYPWSECKATGYPSETPPFLSVWLMIIVDNVMHVVINGAAIQWL